MYRVQGTHGLGSIYMRFRFRRTQAVSSFYGMLGSKDPKLGTIACMLGLNDPTYLGTRVPFLPNSFYEIHNTLEDDLGSILFCYVVRADHHHNYRRLSQVTQLQIADESIHGVDLVAFNSYVSRPCVIRDRTGGSI